MAPYRLASVIQVSGSAFLKINYLHPQHVVKLIHPPASDKVCALLTQQRLEDLGFEKGVSNVKLIWDLRASGYGFHVCLLVDCLYLKTSPHLQYLTFFRGTLQQCLAVKVP